MNSEFTGGHLEYGYGVSPKCIFVSDPNKGFMMIVLNMASHWCNLISYFANILFCETDIKLDCSSEKPYDLFERKLDNHWPPRILKANIRKKRHLREIEDENNRKERLTMKNA